MAHHAHDTHQASGHTHHEMGHEGHPHGGAEHGRGTHDAHAGHSEAAFARVFWVSLILTIPVLLYSDLLQHILGYSAPTFPGSSWLAPVLSSVIYWYCGWVFREGGGLGGRSGAPRHDDAGGARHNHRLLLQPRGHLWAPARDALLFRARHPRHDHAPWPLDGDEGHRQGAERAGGAGEAAARYGRASGGRGDRGGARGGAARGGPGPGAPGGPRAGRRPSRGRPQLPRREHDHRRVQAGEQGGGR